MQTVLVIDDDHHTCNLIATILESKSINVISASNTKDGIALAYDINPDLIILDIFLPHPGVNGLDATDIIRDDPALKKIPILMLTANSNATHEQQAYDKGVDGFMIKPFMPKDVLDHVDDIIGL